MLTEWSSFRKIDGTKVWVRATAYGIASYDGDVLSYKKRTKRVGKVTYGTLNQELKKMGAFRNAAKLMNEHAEKLAAVTDVRALDSAMDFVREEIRAQIEGREMEYFEDSYTQNVIREDLETAKKAGLVTKTSKIGAVKAEPHAQFALCSFSHRYRM